ncbi:MAG: DUF4065 domain-containing protein [Rhodospirillaceae bacterium]|nr:DUF4065 domain-containing protein [Rhodospirillaceae bacterium]
MPFSVNSTFDVAFWFSDQALNENEYLQPQKLHRLLYLAQAHFAVAYEGKKLMPAIFVADELGPIEPTIYQAFTRGRPDVEVELFLPADVEMFLNSIWRRYGHLDANRLNKITCNNNAFSIALRKGKRVEITLEAMVSAFKDTATKGNPTGQAIGEKVMVTQDGAPVKVKSWVPGTKPTSQ